MPARTTVETTEVLENDDGDVFEIVMLSVGDRYVVVSPMDISLTAVAADAPADAAGDQPDDTPDAHDLLTTLVDELDAKVEMIQAMRSPSRERVVTARVTDASTLALRADCHILIGDDLVETVGVTAEELAGQDVEV